MPAIRVARLAALLLGSVACADQSPCSGGELSSAQKQAVTRAPGSYEGYDVSAVEGRAVVVSGKGSATFQAARVQCRSLSSWGYGADGGDPTFTDQDDRCNFEAKLFWLLARDGIQIRPECEFGFPDGIRIERGVDMDRAIEIVGAQLHAENLGVTYTVGLGVIVCL